MAMLLTETPTVNPLRQGRPRPSRESSVLSSCNDQGYRIVDNMRMQSGDLDDISDYNSEEDRVRGRLGAILREQERILIDLGSGSRFALDLNRRAQRALALVDALDAAQGLDEIKGSIDSAKALNQDTAEAGLAVLQMTEPRALRAVKGGLQ